MSFARVDTPPDSPMSTTSSVSCDEEMDQRKLRNRLRTTQVVLGITVVFYALTVVFLVVVVQPGGDTAHAPACPRGGSAPVPQARRAITYVAFGDSITWGQRSEYGHVVTASDTYATKLAAVLNHTAGDVTMINAGVPGMNTVGALDRLDGSVLAHRPDVVTIMFGTNDAYVDAGQTAPRVPLPVYRANLVAIVSALQSKNILPVLMTPPRWGPSYPAENANLEPYVVAVRSVGYATGVHVVDHYGYWTVATQSGTNVASWTTDECHPNALGHEKLAGRIEPTVVGLMQL